MLTPPPPCSMDHQFSTTVGPLAMRHHLHYCPLPSTQMHPVIQNSRGRSSKEAQLTSQLVTLAPKERRSSCVLLQQLLLLSSSPTTSRSHAVAAQGAPCTVGGVFLHACVSVLCVFVFLRACVSLLCVFCSSPLGCSNHMNICGDVP